MDCFVLRLCGVKSASGALARQTRGVEATCELHHSLPKATLDQSFNLTSKCVERMTRDSLRLLEPVEIEGRARSKYLDSTGIKVK